MQHKLPPLPPHCLSVVWSQASYRKLSVLHFSCLWNGNSCICLIGFFWQFPEIPPGRYSCHIAGLIKPHLLFPFASPFCQHTRQATQSQNPELTQALQRPFWTPPLHLCPQPFLLSPQFLCPATPTFLPFSLFFLHTACWVLWLKPTSLPSCPPLSSCSRYKPSPLFRKDWSSFPLLFFLTALFLSFCYYSLKVLATPTFTGGVSLFSTRLSPPMLATASRAPRAECSS